MQRQVLDAAEVLATSPRGPGRQKLSASEELYRVRAGDYRVVYAIDDERQTVRVVKVAHRLDVYR